jgi:hypothetical protein
MTEMETLTDQERTGEWRREGDSWVYEDLYYASASVKADMLRVASDDLGGASIPLAVIRDLLARGGG